MARKMRFEASQARGPHAALAKMAGDWEGEIRTWFEPGKLADTSRVEGSVRLALGGRFAVHEYRASLQGAPFEGMAVHGHDLQRGGFETAWVDMFHNGTRVMLSQGEGGARRGRWSVRGSYPDGIGGPDWGWRTEVDVSKTPGRLTITHYNVTPTGEEAKAVEFAYVRRAAKAAAKRAKPAAKRKARR